MNDLIRYPMQQFVGLMYDQYQRPVGVAAVQQETYVEVKLDRVQLRAFANAILDALKQVEG